MIGFLRILFILIFINISIQSFAGANDIVKTNIIFRYDDFSADSPGDRSHNTYRKQVWLAEQEMDSIFKNYKMPYVIGITPYMKNNYQAQQEQTISYCSFAEDVEKCTFLKNTNDDGHIEIAQHGFSHNNYSPVTTRASEFNGRSYDDQYSDIMYGKQILINALGLKGIDVFIPPYNGWDQKTADALVSNAFRILSADRYFYTDTNLTIVPFTAQLWELEKLFDYNYNIDNSIIVVLLHPTQLVKTTGIESVFFGLDRLKILLQKISQRDNCQVVTFRQLVDSNILNNNYRYKQSYLLAYHKTIWEKVLPADYLYNNSDQVFLTIQNYKKQIFFWRLLLIFTLALSPVIFIRIINYLDKKKDYKYLYHIVLMSFVSILLCLYLIIDITRRNYHITIVRIVPLSISIGCFCYFIYNVFKRKIFKI